MSGPLVSVVMPAFDEEAFIAEALESVVAQAYEPVEVIVVDDGSEDRTAEIADGYGARVLRQPRRGVAAARNAGLEAARGDYWTILDADDVLPPDALAHYVAHLEGHPELGLVFGLTEAFVTPAESRPPHFSPAWDRGPYAWHSGAMMARREVLEAVGPFDETRRLGEDMDWFARAREAGVRSGSTEQLVLLHRVHARNSTSDTRANQAAMLSVLRQSLHRRRAEAEDG
jgi:glycosyltransferase involved in cell wall biosynthesis